MYWSQDDFERWTEHINGIVGENSEEGAFIAAEKTKGIEILMAGKKQEVLEVMASMIFYFSKNHGVAFEDALIDIQNTWDQLKRKDGYMQVDDEIVDIKTGIGINKKEGLISFPIPPKDIQDKMIASIEITNSKIGAVKERLGSVKDILAFFEDCTEVGGFVANEETSEKGIAFVYSGDRFMYIPENNKPGMLTCSTDTGEIGLDYFEDDDIFRKVVMKLLEESGGIYQR